MSEPASPPYETAVVPTLQPGRQLTIRATFPSPGDSILGVCFADAAPIAIPIRILTAGAHRFRIEFEDPDSDSDMSEYP